MATTDGKALEEFKKITALPHSDQAKYFLNAFWEEAGPNAENVWLWVLKFEELDQENKKKGNSLDEFSAHRFLEQVGETKRVVELRETLRKIDLDFNKRMAVVEYLLWKNKQSIKELLSRPQGDNTAQIKEAQAMLDAAQAALDDLLVQLEQEKTALAEAKRLATEQKKAEDSVRAAEEELRQAVNELKAQEDAYHNKLKDLEAKSKDTSASVVQRNKAANELAQAKGEDPLPLRKAKITQEAALRKVEKERKVAEAATAKALEAQHAAEARTKQVEVAVKETEKRFQEAQDFLEAAKKKGGVPKGSIWWMERELKEKQKYLPKSKQTLL
jgi:chromosome segregation ATPase